MNRIVTATAAVVFIAASNAKATGIPVFDASNLAQAVQQVTHMVEQIEMLQGQLDKMQETLDSMTGARGFGSGFAGGSYDSLLKGKIDGVLKDYGVNDAAHWGLDKALGDYYTRDNESAATYFKRSQDSLDQSKGRFSDLQGLIDAIDGANDQKAILDLQARIAGEQALLENERIKLAAIQAEAEAQRRMQERAALQMRLNTIKRTPLEW
jgi:type IV secretion system protein VirB5